MPTKFAKGDEVRVDAKQIDGEGELDELGLKWRDAKQIDGEGELDELGLKWSERWLRDWNGVWCYDGKISFVFKK
jgi:hypothetical protein